MIVEKHRVPGEKLIAENNGGLVRNVCQAASFSAQSANSTPQTAGHFDASVRPVRAQYSLIYELQTAVSSRSRNEDKQPLRKLRSDRKFSAQ